PLSLSLSRLLGSDRVSMRSLFTLFLIFSIGTSLNDGIRRFLHEERSPSWAIRANPNWGPVHVQPEQVHLSWAGANAYWVTWMTFDDVLEATVQYGNTKKGRNLGKIENGKISYFKDGKTSRYVSRVKIVLDDDEDKPGDIYRYRVGSNRGWSSIFEFRYLNPREDGGYEIAFYGDMGNENARSMGMIQRMVQDGDIDLIHHVGDYGYDLNTDNGRVGDEFFRQIESAAAYVAYQPTPGNHEAADNFTHYFHRFTPPNGGDPIFYSYDLDQIHFISFSTEVYFYTDYGFDLIRRQFEWLQKELKKANANRDSVPWIIAMGHRPMYCSDFDGDDCTKYESIVRTGMPGTHAYALERLFYDEGVDLLFFAHEHSYERLYPVFDRRVYTGPNSPYVDPPAPVHIVSGSAGCRENVDPFIEKPEPWSAFRSSNYGIGLLRVYNATHLRYKQIVAATESIEDELWLVKSRHGPYDKHDKRKMEKHGIRVPIDFNAANDEKIFF
ncbi:hypothetical protein PENTCL1PPCAC_2602, partial [Pristionchus entomophagus]